MTHHFQHRGRRYRLFTRERAPGAPLYLALRDRGRRRPRSLGTPIKTAAVEKARVIIDSVQSGNLQAARSLLQRNGQASGLACSTIGEVLSWCELTPLGITERTASNYRNCTRLWLRRAGVADPDGAPVDVLNEGTVRAFVRSVHARTAGLDQEATRQAQLSANSILHQSSCLFGPRFVGHMRDTGLMVPDMAGFRAAVKAYRFRIGGAGDWHAPEDAVLLTTLRAWRSVREEDWNVFAAMWLALSCGLRAGEIAQARWDWFKLRKGSIWLDTEARVKNKTGRILVEPVSPWFWQGYRWRGERSGRILEGDPNETGNEVFRRVSAFLSGCGWRTVKRTHALRAWAGARAFELRGIYGAQQFLRHSSVTVTERHYSHLIKK